MNIPHDVIENVTVDCPYILNPVVSLILGLFHLFPLCCITSFVLAEVGITVETYTGIHLEQFQRMESDFYDDYHKMHLCIFHAQQAINIELRIKDYRRKHWLRDTTF